MSGLEQYFPEPDAFDFGTERRVLPVGIAEDLATPRQKVKGKRQN